MSLVISSQYQIVTWIMSPKCCKSVFTFSEDSVFDAKTRIWKYTMKEALACYYFKEWSIGKCQSISQGHLLKANTKYKGFKDEQGWALPLSWAEEADMKITNTAEQFTIQRAFQKSTGLSLLVYWTSWCYQYFLVWMSYYFLLSYRVLYLLLDKWQTSSDKCPNTPVIAIYQSD